MGMTRKSTPREMEIRTENRYTLHPQGKKRCTKCETVYDDVHGNFDVHHLTKDGMYSYTGQCKTCLSAIRSERSDRYKTDINLYVKRLLPAIRCRAKEDGLDFNLTADYLVQLWQEQGGLCYYMGTQMDLQAATSDRKSPHIDFPSVDMVDPAIGYVTGNVVWCTWGINRMKNNLTKDQFILFCKAVTERFVV